MEKQEIIHQLLIDFNNNLDKSKINIQNRINTILQSMNEMQQFMDDNNLNMNNNRQNLTMSVSVLQPTIDVMKGKKDKIEKIQSEVISIETVLDQLMKQMNSIRSMFDDIIDKSKIDIFSIYNNIKDEYEQQKRIELEKLEQQRSMTEQKYQLKQSRLSQMISKGVNNSFEDISRIQRISRMSETSQTIPMRYSQQNQPMKQSQTNIQMNTSFSCNQSQQIPIVSQLSPMQQIEQCPTNQSMNQMIGKQYEQDTQPFVQIDYEDQNQDILESQQRIYNMQMNVNSYNNNNNNNLNTNSFNDIVFNNSVNNNSNNNTNSYKSVNNNSNISNNMNEKLLNTISSQRQNLYQMEQLQPKKNSIRNLVEEICELECDKQLFYYSADSIEEEKRNLLNVDVDDRNEKTFDKCVPDNENICVVIEDTNGNIFGGFVSGIIGLETYHNSKNCFLFTKKDE